MIFINFLVLSHQQVTKWPAALVGQGKLANSCYGQVDCWTLTDSSSWWVRWELEEMMKTMLLMENPRSLRTSVEDETKKKTHFIAPIVCVQGNKG